MIYYKFILYIIMMYIFWFPYVTFTSMKSWKALAALDGSQSVQNAPWRPCEDFELVVWSY